MHSADKRYLAVDIDGDVPPFTTPHDWGNAPNVRETVNSWDDVKRIEGETHVIVCSPGHFYRSCDDEFRDETTSDAGSVNTTDVVMRQLMSKSHVKRNPKLRRKSLIGAATLEVFLRKALTPAQLKPLRVSPQAARMVMMTKSNQAPLQLQQSQQM